MKGKKFNHGHIIQMIGIVIIIINGIHGWFGGWIVWVYAGLIPMVYETGLIIGKDTKLTKG